jgi:hypothetical protein
MPFEIDLRCFSTVSTRTTNTQALTTGSPPRYSEPKQRSSPPACIVKADTISVKGGQDSPIKFWTEISPGSTNGNIDTDSARGLPHPQHINRVSNPFELNLIDVSSELDMHQVLSGGCFTFGCLGTWPCTNKRIPAHKGMIGSCLDNHREGNHEQFPWLNYDGRVLYRRRGHSSLINEGYMLAISSKDV